MTRILNNQAFSAMQCAFRLAVLFVAGAVASGCISAKSNTFSAKGTSASSATAAYGSLSDRWVVVVGDNLWGISADEAVYQEPERWPLLYKRNLDKIDDADLIYPGQILEIARDATAGEISAAVQHARNRGAWAVGSVELSDRQYLKTSP